MPILTGNARVAGVSGWPVNLSRSPRLHGFWLERHKIDGIYIPLPIPPGHYHTAIKGLVTAGLVGCNVTQPHKLVAFEVCDTVDESARRAGAVNTLCFRDGHITGYNTDGMGFVGNLRAHGVDPASGPALILGAGGAARAIAAVLLAMGTPVTIANRTRERAETLAKDLPGLGLIDWDKRDAALADHAMVVNTTSLGMQGKGALDLNLDSASPRMVVADIVYVPLETPLLAAAKARGLRPVEGLGMLLHQAVPGFTHWFGVQPTVDDELRRFVAADLITS
jgi:shikimate dehydrogenase